MGLTSGLFISLIVLAAVGSLAATVWLWPRVAGQRIRDLGARVGLLVLCQALVIAAFLAFLNSYFSFFGSWSELVGSGAPLRARIAAPGVDAKPLVVTATDLGPMLGGSVLPVQADGALASRPPGAPASPPSLVSPPWSGGPPSPFGPPRPSARLRPAARLRPRRFARRSAAGRRDQSGRRARFGPRPGFQGWVTTGRITTGRIATGRIATGRCAGARRAGRDPGRPGPECRGCQRRGAPDSDQRTAIRNRGRPGLSLPSAAVFPACVRQG